MRAAQQVTSDKSKEKLSPDWFMRQPINYCYFYSENYYRYRQLPTVAETFVHLSSFLASPDQRTTHSPAHRSTSDGTSKTAMNLLTASF
jgi:hypothetical protein